MCVIGPSGSGKSTFLRCLNRLEEPTSGHILFEGTDITDKKTDIDRHRQKMGMVFQQFNLFPHMTILKNLTLAPVKLQGRSEEEAKNQAMALLDKVGLADRCNAYPNQLSGGQRQRVAFARALAPNPELLLLDEPFAAIDAKVRQELRSWLREMITRVGITSIFVTHDQDEAIEVADEIIITNHGHIEQAGTPIEIYSQPKTPFVTEFMGSPTRISNITSFHGYEELGEGLHAVVRPEHVSVTKKTEQSRFSSSVEEGVVERVMFRGREVELHVRVHDVLLVANRRLEEASITEGERVNVFIYQVFAFPAGENGTQNVNIVENANIETEKLFYI